jgi:hypothetical protein
MSNTKTVAVLECHGCGDPIAVVGPLNVVEACRRCAEYAQLFEAKRLADREKLNPFGYVDRVDVGVVNYRRPPNVEEDSIILATVIGLVLLAGLVLAWVCSKSLIVYLYEVSR